eukprot:gb/GECG01002369.1/.p1 GENE.gb/GECG01002369.1/~~gb/GECG01002369.1/.p1  ORF type:complete len:704 (+),score=137.16 gb/GECG01002369.1/:1-2112(+)
MSLASKLGTPLYGKVQNKEGETSAQRPVGAVQASNDKYAEYTSGVVRDRRGNERFHGAFTGGWSAGYFNTVGTKEGWTPSQFVPSRQKKGAGADEEESVKKHPYQTPEDLMDEEDKATLLGQKLRPAGKYDTFGAKKHEAVWDRVQTESKEGEKRSFALGPDQWASIVSTPVSSIGVQILQKMGWRYGQGIGPKLRKKEKDGESEAKSGDEADPLDEAFVAPKPTEVYRPEDYTGYHGLGYYNEEFGNRFQGKSGKALVEPNSSGSQSLMSKERGSRSSGESSNKLQMVDVLKKPSGLNVLGVEHDEETYGLTGFQQEEYDIPQTKAEALAEKERKTEDKSQHRDVQHQKDDPQMLTAGLVCHDGRPPLDGFHLRTTRRQLGIARLHPDTIKVPPSFVPHHKFAHPPPPIELKFQGFKSSSERSSAYGDREQTSSTASIVQTSTAMSTSSIRGGSTVSLAELSDRFVSAGSLEKEKELANTATTDDAKVTEKNNDSFQLFLSQKPSRESKEWLPSKLVCKRFNVRTPRKVLHEDPTGSGVETGGTGNTQHQPRTDSSGPPTKAQVPGGSMVPEKLEPGENRPVDLLSAVFNVGGNADALSSSDDSDDDGEDAETTGSTAKSETKQVSSASGTERRVHSETSAGPEAKPSSIEPLGEDTRTSVSKEMKEDKKKKKHKHKQKHKHKHKSKSSRKKKRSRSGSGSE